MIDRFYYNKKIKNFSVDSNDHDEAIKDSNEKKSNLSHDINKTEYQLKTRSHLQKTLDNKNYLNIGGRLKNMISGGKYSGDYRKNKLDRLEKERSNQDARKEYHEKEKKLDKE